MSIENFEYKGLKFYKEKLKEVGVLDKLKFFNDVITEKRPPHKDGGYHLVLKDLNVDGEIWDIYHTDQDENGDYIDGHTWHSIFIHKK